MRLLLAEFDSVLGLTGTIVFPTDRPLVIYGENTSGKSNVINALRYCLNPPLGRRTQQYSEGKMPSKQEMLIDPLNYGSITLYFVQQGNLYKLEDEFRRGSTGITRSDDLYITEGDPPAEDAEAALTNIDWGAPAESGVTDIKERLQRDAVYPELLDVLIAPSNVANFAEAVSGEIVAVPELIRERITERKERATFYQRHLNALQNTCDKQKNLLTERQEELKQAFIDFDFDTVGLSQEAATECFEDGAQAVREFKEEVETRRRKLPTEQQQAQRAAEVAETIQSRLQHIHEAEAAVARQDELHTAVQALPEYENALTIVHDWQTKVNNLPADNMAHLLDMSPPEVDEFDFGLLEEGDRVETHLTKIAAIQSQMEDVNQVRQEAGLAWGTLEQRRDDLQRLAQSVEMPIEKPDGVDTVLFVTDNDEARVGVPDEAIDELDREPAYTTISGTPQVFRSESEATETDRLETYRTQIEDRLSKLDTAVATLQEAQTSLKQTKQYLGTQLEAEEQQLNQEKERRHRTINDVKEKWSTTYASLCSTFDLEQQELAYETTDAIDRAAQRIEAGIAAAENAIATELKDRLSTFDDISIPDEMTAESLEELGEQLEKQHQELEDAEEILDDIESWIDQNTAEIEALSEKLATNTIARDVATMGSLIFDTIAQQSDLTELVDDLSKKIEHNVEAIYRYIFPDDDVRFRYVGDGEFQCTIHDEPITHPSGSQRAVISFGIMLSLAKSFDLPILLDEAGDRFDYTRLTQFLEFINGVTEDSDIQTCLVMCKSKDIEAYEEVREQLATAAIYRLKRVSTVRNEIEPCEIDSLVESSSSV